MKLRNILIVSGIVLLTIAIGYLLYNTFVFRVTNITPPGKEFPNFARYVDFYFSHPIKSVKSVELNGERVYGEIKIEGKRVRYTQPGRFEENTALTLRLLEVTAENGSRLDATHHFTPRYFNFSDLPEDVRKESIEKGSSGQHDDPFFNTYFPIVQDGYEIEYIQSETSSEPSLYVTFLREVIDYDTGQQTYLPDGEAEAMRTKVFDHIKKLGGDPGKYEIHYANPYLEQKYNPVEHNH